MRANSQPVQLVMQCSPQQLGARRTDRIMLQVLAACVPAILASTWFFGIGQLLNVTLAAVFATALEATVDHLRGRDLRTSLRDHSGLVTAVLLGIAMPPGSPWWLVLAGCMFALLLGKHAFGGLGQNMFNPAMCGYAFLLLSFPLQMTTWHVPLPLREAADFSPLSPAQLLLSLQLALPFLPFADPASAGLPDGMALATPLIEQKLAARNAVRAALDGGFGWGFLLDRRAGTGWELVNYSFLAGGLFLLARRIISWHIPLAVIGTVWLLATLFHSEAGTNVYGTAYLHLFGSATMIGAFFIATDPVSAAQTARGKLCYGILIGSAIYCIRVWGSYLDSVAFAVLLGNFCAPLVDRLCRRRAYGTTGASP